MYHFLKMIDKILLGARVEEKLPSISLSTEGGSDLLFLYTMIV